MVHSPIGGVRWSTVVVLAVFLALGFSPRVGPRKAALGALAWLIGFEVAWQFTTGALASDRTEAGLVSRGLQVMAAGLGWAVAAHYAGIRAYRPAVVITALLWAAWVLTGFQSLDQGSLIGEALNEAAKTSWALIYLWPLMERARPRPGYTGSSESRSIAAPLSASS